MTLIDCKKHIGRVKWILFWVIFMQIISEYLITTVVTFIPFNIHKYIIMGLKELITFLPPLLIYARFTKKPTLIPMKAEYRINNISLINVIFIALMAIGGQFIMMLLNVPMNILMETVFNKDITSAVPIAENTLEFCMGLLFMAIVPAILEELWMRGIVFGAFANYSTRSALIFTTIIFALLHAKFSQVLGILFLGFMTGYVLIKTNSLLAPIIYHIFSNASALVAGRFISGILSDKELYSMLGVFILLFISALLVFMVINRKRKTVKGKYDFSIAIGGLFSVPVFLAIVMVVVNGYIYNLI